MVLTKSVVRIIEKYILGLKEKVYKIEINLLKRITRVTLNIVLSRVELHLI